MGRKLSRWEVAGRVVGRVWSHPCNRGHRAAALARAVGWQVYKRLVGGAVDVRFPEGATVRCYPDSGSAGNVIYFNRYYDYHEMAFLRRYLRPGDGFIDGGANIGTYSMLVAALVGPSGRIDAFEPFAKSAERVRENARLNGFENVHVHEAALADEAGVDAFVVDRDVSNRLRTSTDVGARVIEVQVRRLDQVVSPGSSRYALAKLDVEGAELRALLGAEALLRAGEPSVWLLEVTPGLLRKRGTSPEELRAFLEQRGYRLARYDADRRSLIFDREAWRTSANVLAISEAATSAIHERLASAAPQPLIEPWTFAVVRRANGAAARGAR